jgi:hypothetical protein
VSLDDWILALHLLAAFTMAAAVFGLWVVVLSARAAERPSGVAAALRMLPPMGAMAGIGSVLTLVFGIWLAISIDQYEVWDGWIIAAIVVWLVASGAGERSGREYALAETRAHELTAGGADDPDPGLRALTRTSRGFALHAVATVGLIVVLVLMIWKPGA